MLFKKTKPQLILTGVVFIIFSAYAVTLIFPLVWIFYSSFKPMSKFAYDVFGLPKAIDIVNWRAILSLEISQVTILGMYANSLIFIVVNTTLSMFITSATAYVVCKYEFPGRRIIYWISLVIILVPTLGSISAMYRFYQQMGLYDTYHGIFIMATGGFGMGFILLYGFFKNIPWAYAEAASIDGAGDMTIFLRVMMPQAVPAIAAVGVISAIGIWNDYFTIYMYAPSRVTVAYGVKLIVDRMTYDSNYPLMFAGITASVIPILVIFTIFSRTIMENMIAGGLKG